MNQSECEFMFLEKCIDNPWLKLKLNICIVEKNIESMVLKFSRISGTSMTSLWRHSFSCHYDVILSENSVT